MRASTSIGLCSAVLLLTSPADADTFGGQVHGVRSRAAFDGVEIKATQDRDARLPAAIELGDGGELAGGDFRFDWMFGDLRLGAGLGVYGVRDLRLSAPQSTSDLRFATGFGASFETFVGYELMQGPFYLYLDARVVAHAFEVPVQLRDPNTDETLEADYGLGTVGAGPRLGALVPVGHSLMIDLAVYQRVVGGIEGTAAFVGFGYWENDRGDDFTQELKRSFGGDF